jgi:hypothetical protein
MTYKRVLTAADDAINSAAESMYRTSRKVDKKFSKAIDLLSGLEKDFPSKDPTSDEKIGGAVSGEAKNDKSEYALTILYALKKNLHAKVKFPSVSLPLNADGS